MAGRIPTPPLCTRDKHFPRGKKKRDELRTLKKEVNSKKPPRHMGPRTKKETKRQPQGGMSGESAQSRYIGSIWMDGLTVCLCVVRVCVGTGPRRSVSSLTPAPRPGPPKTL